MIFCIFCKNEIKKGAEIIDAKKIKTENILTRKMVSGIDEKGNTVNAHALCYEINVKKYSALHTHALAKTKSENSDIIMNALLSSFITEQSTPEEIREWEKVQA